MDDVNGWDFLDHDNDPSHSEEDFGHGTAVAGIAAARGDNGIGVSGICPLCRVLPVRLMTQFASGDQLDADDVSMAEGFRYAASLADVVNGSWGIYPADVVTTAVEDVGRNGRDGKGTVMMFATGNAASGLTYFAMWGREGTHRLQLNYIKDGSGSAGDDTVWLAWVALPEGDVVSFENGLPQGWETFGDAPWAATEDPVHADESGCITHPLKAGPIGDGQTSGLTFLIEQSEPGGTRVRYWVSSEADADGLQYLFDAQNDGTIDYSGFMSGVPLVKPGVAYPASLPETMAAGSSSNWDCRAHYSRFGEEMDFLAPSAAGYYLTAPILTTDRSGEPGYDVSDYTDIFGGTSAAAPMAAGVAGLILSAAPELTAAEVRRLMRETADKVGPEPYVDGRNDRYGYGRINAHRALAALVGEPETADLVLTKTAETDRVRLHEELTYTLSVTNGGPAEATNVTVVDTLPREVTFEEASEGCAFDKGMLVCSVTSLPAGQSKAFEFEVIVSQVPEDRLLINQATVTASQDDANEGNNSAETATQVIGEMSPSKGED